MIAVDKFRATEVQHVGIGHLMVVEDDRQGSRHFAIRVDDPRLESPANTAAIVLRHEISPRQFGPWLEVDMQRVPCLDLGVRPRVISGTAKLLEGALSNARPAPGCLIVLGGAAAMHTISRTGAVNWNVSTWQAIAASQPQWRIDDWQLVVDSVEGNPEVVIRYHGDYSPPAP